MSTDPYSAFRSAPIFSNLDDPTLGLMMGAMRTRVVPRGPLLKQGESGDTMMVLSSGQLEVRYQPKRGPAVFIDHIEPGEVLGELSCCDPAPLAASVSATMESVVYELDRTMLDTLKTHAPQLASELYQGLIGCVSARSRALETRILKSSGPLRRLGARVLPRTSPAQVQRNLDHTGMDGMSSEDIEMLREVGKHRGLTKGETLFKERAPGRACYVIIEGQLDVLRGPEGRLRRLCTLGPGALVGQMALINEAPRSATIRALNEVALLEIHEGLFKRLLRSEQAFALRFQEKIAVSAIRQHRRILERLDGILQLASTSPLIEEDQRVEDELEKTLGDHAAGLREMSISPDELSGISVVVPDGQVTAAEVKARLGR